MVLTKSGNLPILTTFNASDNTLSGHVWKINGIVESGATGASFTKSFNAYGNYVIEHSGTNACGSACQPFTETLTLSQVPSPGTNALPIPVEVLYGLMAVGALGFVWYNSQPKK